MFEPTEMMRDYYNAPLTYYVSTVTYDYVVDFDATPECIDFTVKQPDYLSITRAICGGAGDFA